MCTPCFITLHVYSMLYIPMCTICFITLHVYSMLYNSVCVLYVLQLYLSREESTAVEPANISLSEYSSLSSSGGSEDEAGVEDWSKDSIRSNHHHSWDISKITMTWIHFINEIMFLVLIIFIDIQIWIVHTNPFQKTNVQCSMMILV